MPADTPTTNNYSNLAVGTFASAAGLLLGIFGSLFFRGNLISTQQYTTARLLNNTQAFEITTATGSTATGGLKSGGVGNYLAVNIPSPLSATGAAANGVNVGTGTIAMAAIDLVAPQSTGTITCSVHKDTNRRGTGGTLVFSSRKMATGAILYFSTGSIVIGPADDFSCATNPVPSASFSVKALLRIVPSQVTVH